MNAENLLSTPERIRILEAVAFQTGKISVNQVAAKLGLSKGMVSKYMDLLVRDGIAKRTNGKFLVDHGAQLLKGIKILLNVGRFDPRTFKRHPFVEAAGLYGSCSKGENTEDSDVDLWIRVGETAEGPKATLAAELRKKIKGVKTLFLSHGKIKELRAKDTLFYHALVFGSITLWGDPHALEL